MNVRTGALVVVTTVASVYALREGGLLAAPLLLSVLLAYALEPPVALLVRWRLPRLAAVIAVFTLLAVSAVFAGRLAQQQIVEFVAALPAAAAEAGELLAPPRNAAGRGEGPLDRLRRAAAELEAALDAPVQKPASGAARVAPVDAPFSLRAYIQRFSTTIAAGAAECGVVGLLTFLLLLTGESLKRRLIAMAGPRLAQKKLTYDVIKAIDRQIERYLIARVLISAIVAAATALALWTIGVRQPLALGVIAGLLNVVPFIGPAVAVGLIGIVAFLQYHAIETAAAAVFAAGIIAALEGNLISPWLTSRAGELNTVAVFVSVLFWGWMWDAWGLVLAIPIMVAIKAAADHVEPLQPLAELLGR